jgi:hypothetical protein
MATSPVLPEIHQGQLTFWLEEHPASPSVLPESGEDWTIRAATSRLSFWRWLEDLSLDGSFGKTCLGFCRTMEDGRLEPSSLSWGNSGMGSPTEFSTLKISESHSAAVACSLSDVLETGDVPQRFYLSAKACVGILRRAAKRGRQLPHSLQTALEHAARAITKHRQDT